jgi:type IV fimbrial biogenesis protein FimT
MGAPRKKNGFTLMELMMTLAVVGVILAIAIPNFRDFLLNSRMTGAANDLLGGIQLARSEAIKRQVPVAICASANPTANPPACAAQFTGWAVWVDTDDDAAIDNGEAVIASHEPPNAQLTLISNGSGFVSYGPDGFSRPNVGGNAATNLVLLCDERANLLVGDIYRKRAVVLGQTGRPSVLRQQTELTSLGAAAICP